MDLDERFAHDSQTDTGWTSRRRSSGCRKMVFPAIVVTFLALPFLPWTKVKSGLLEVADRLNKPKEKIVTVEVKEPPPPLPAKFVYTTDVNVAELSNGMQINNEIETLPGGSASVERATEGSYKVSFKITVNQPEPSKTLEDLGKLNPHLAKCLPGLAQMMPTAKVSQFYYKLYEEKKREIAVDMTRLDKILTRHNYYDLETLLELEHPTSGQRILLMQAEMDVVSDGSDGDRMPTFDDYIAKSAHFQPTTSYWWKKLTTQPNPLLSAYQDKQKSFLEKASKGTAAEKKSAKENAEFYGRYITDLKTKSYLIGQEDPFVVIPLTFRQYIGTHPFAPNIGDYAVILYEDKAYPAVIGDFGPREKVGEASLRIAKQISNSSNPNRRPISDLKATYLFFPGSAAKPWAVPNFAKWQAACGDLLAKVGGLGAGYSLHTWEDRFAPKPKPADPKPVEK